MKPETPTERIGDEATLLRVFIGESDWHGYLPLYEALVLRARELGLAGATVLRGPMGFRTNSTVHTAKKSLKTPRQPTGEHLYF